MNQSLFSASRVWSDDRGILSGGRPIVDGTRSYPYRGSAGDRQSKKKQWMDRTIFRRLFRATHNVIFEWKQSGKLLVEMHLVVSKFHRYDMFLKRR